MRSHTNSIQQDVSSNNIQPPEQQPLNNTFKLTQLTFIFSYAATYMISYIAYLLWHHQVLYLLVSYWMVDVLVFVFLIYVRFKHNLIFGYLIIDTLIGAIYKFLVLLYFEIYPIRLDYFGYILIGYYLLRILIVNMRKISKREVINSYKLLIQGIKLLMILQIMIVTLRMTDVIKWNWYSVFSISWGLLIIAFIVHFVFVLSVGEALIDYARNKITPSQLIGSIWFTLFLTGFSGFPMWFLLEVSWNLEDNADRTNQLIKLFILMIAFDLLIIISSFLLKRHLILFLEDSNLENVKIQESKSERKSFSYLTIKIPINLIQISTTYFEFQQLPEKTKPPSINASIVNQKSKLKAFEFMAKTEQINSPAEKEEYLVPNDDKCQICFEYEHNIVFLPCQHGGICEICLDKCLSKSRQCYLCREKIERVLRVKKGQVQGNYVVKDFARIQS